MESSDDSSTEFEGFGPEVVEAARKELLELVEVNPEDISDVDISDISDIETESESENDDNPLEENENGTDAHGEKCFKMLILRILPVLLALQEH